jgi:hypothetical protein
MITAELKNSSAKIFRDIKGKFMWGGKHSLISIEEKFLPIFAMNVKFGLGLT